MKDGPLKRRPAGSGQRCSWDPGLRWRRGDYELVLGAPLAGGVRSFPNEADGIDLAMMATGFSPVLLMREQAAPAW